MRKIGIVGGTGWLGSAFARQLLKQHFIDADQIWIANRSGRTLSVPEDEDIHYTTNPQQLVDHCDCIILCVRPQDFKAVQMRCGKNLVISVMAGVSVAEIKQQIGASRIVRAMPNAALEIAASYTPWYASGTSTEQQDFVKRLFVLIGTEDQVMNEDHIDFFTALTGSGQGWVTFFQHTLIQAGIAAGLSSPVTERAIRQLFVGMSELQMQSKESTTHWLQLLIDYAGTTAAGLKVLQKSNVAQDVNEAILAAYEKAKTLV